MPDIKEQKDTLYVKLPIIIKEELIIKNLHPDIEDVRIPRQKRAKFCLIKFTDTEKCTKVKNDLREKTIDGKPIFISYGRKKIFKNLKECVKLIVLKLPDNIHKKEVKKAIPKATKIKIRRANKKRKYTWALLVFESKKNAEEVVSKGSLNVKDVDVEVKYYQKIGRKNRKTKKIKENNSKKEPVHNPRYFEVTLDNINADSESDSADSNTDVSSDHSDLESFDLEYNGCFDSDSD